MDEKFEENYVTYANAFSIERANETLAWWNVMFEMGIRIRSEITVASQR